MNSSLPNPSADKVPAARVFEGRNAFQAALRQAFADIADAGPREVWMCDDNFADWPLNEVQVVEQLGLWARGPRTCTVVALNYDRLPQSHPRWVQWRRQYGHVVACRTPDEVDMARLPCVLLAPGVLTLRLVDRLRFRGSVSTDPADAFREREHIDALLQRSVDAFPASTLGL
jgi:hypothetical protein